MRSVLLKTVAACGVALLFCATNVMAGPITGTVYLDVPDPGNAGDAANQGSTLASAMFSASTIDFETNSSDTTTIGNFLGNPVFSNLLNGFSASHLTDNSELILTGQAFLNAGANAFVVGHDDGVVLTFADPTIGTVVNAPGPTALTETPFNVNASSAGLYGFTLEYAECCGGPADLVFTINGAPPSGPSGVPEPASLVVLGAGMVGLFASRRRRITGSPSV